MTISSHHYFGLVILIFKLLHDVEHFSETNVGCTASYTLSKVYDVLDGFATPLIRILSTTAIPTLTKRSNHNSLKLQVYPLPLFTSE